MQTADNTITEASLLVKLTPKENKRFWKKVNKTESCWLWTANTVNGGYGRFNFRGRQEMVHRISFMLHKGQIPNGLWVLHNCPTGDTPGCLNPEHLWLGTSLDNNQDMVRKGRARYLKGDESWIRQNPQRILRGESHGAAKLKEGQVKQILIRYANGQRICDLAEEYGISRTNISQIVHRQSWLHLA